MNQFAPVSPEHKQTIDGKTLRVIEVENEMQILGAQVLGTQEL